MFLINLYITRYYMYNRKKLLVFGIVLVALALVTIGAAGSLVTSSSINTSAFAQGEQKFTANLTGKDEVPPKDTNATGSGEFNLNADGMMMTYVVNVMNIR
jgi:hypothetical protein